MLVKSGVKTAVFGKQVSCDIDMLRMTIMHAIAWSEWQPARNL